jgi:predicted  nucleic acid-binding Zn-ribbon protein
MASPHIENLLIIQDRDQVVRGLKDQLQAIPLVIQKHEAEIQAETDALEESKSKLQTLEVQRKNLDIQVGSAEEQINKYKNQQLQVKKNEEFQALTHEIEVLKKKISDMEEEEIGLLLDIDEEMVVFKKREGVFDQDVAKIRESISTLEAKNAETEKQLVEAEANFEASKGQVKDTIFNRYYRLTEGINLPVVAPLELQTCQGCHLRVSNDTLEQARKGEGLTTCDNCGRIVYLAS